MGERVKYVSGQYKINWICLDLVKKLLFAI